MKRFIRYLYEYEGNQKKRNVGFVKVEQDGKETTISVHGKGLCGKSNENISCYLIKLDSETGNILFVPTGEIQIGVISCGGSFCYTEELIRAGSGKTEQSVGQLCEKKDDICGLGLGDPKETFYVALWNEEMYGDLDIAKAVVEVEKCGETETARTGEKLTAEVENVEKAEPQENQDTKMAAEFHENEDGKMTVEPQQVEDQEQEDIAEVQRENDSTDKAEDSRRQIMKIQRGEISILPRCEWKLANNNFLLHGYYNYRHLVLIDEGNQLKLGVPGIYHEREARAAATFGFVEFIPMAKLDASWEEEADENETFGYWCRQVKEPVTR